MNIILFVILTSIAYIAIDFAVYWLGSSQLVEVSIITKHHLRMLPVYLIANIILTIGFIIGSKSMSPILLFGISITIWIVSLIIVSMVLYQAKLNIMILAGLAVVVLGVIIINHDLTTQ